MHWDLGVHVVAQLVQRHWLPGRCRPLGLEVPVCVDVIWVNMSALSLDVWLCDFSFPVSPGEWVSRSWA